MKYETLRDISLTITCATNHDNVLEYYRKQTELLEKLYYAIKQKYKETDDMALLNLMDAVLDGKMALRDCCNIASYIKKYPELTEQETDPFMQKGAD